MNKPLDFLETTLSTFQARYGEAIPDNDYPTNEFVENILKRKTVRRFTDQKIDPKLLERLFAAAQSAPTSSMLQTWCAIIIDSKERRQEIFFDDPENRIHMGVNPREILKNGEWIEYGPGDLGNYNAVMECSTFIVWCVDYNVIEEIHTNPEVNKLNMYPQDTIEKAREGIGYATNEVRAICDAMVSAQTFCLAAESLGLGTMYCGSIKTTDLKDYLELPNHVMPIVGICVGYAQPNLNPMGQLPQYDKPDYVKPRLPQSVVVHQHKFQPRDIQKLKRYNSIMTRFYIFYQIGKITSDWFWKTMVRNQIHRRNAAYKSLMQKYGFWFK